MKTKMQYLMTKEGKDGKGNPFKKVIAKNKVQKASFQKYGFKSAPIEKIEKAGKPDQKVTLADLSKVTKTDLLDTLKVQEGKVTAEQLNMTREELIQEI